MELTSTIIIGDDILGWGNIVIEGHCLYGSDNCYDLACRDNPKQVSRHCLSDPIHQKKCPHFAFGTARSCVVLTNRHGDEIAYQAFFCDDQDSGKYRAQEDDWLNHWKEIISDNKD